MQYVYILISEKDRGLYIGKTNNVARRLQEHNTGHTPSLRARIPLRILEIHECPDELTARVLEKEFKKGYKREDIKRRHGLM